MNKNRKKKKETIVEEKKKLEKLAKVPEQSLSVSHLVFKGKLKK